MIIFVFLLLAVSLIGISIAPRNEFYSDYCGKDSSTAINGIFTLLIFFSHSRLEQFEMSGVLDISYKSFAGYLGQTVITSYLFFSGFGIMEQIKKNGWAYTKKIPLKRIFVTWFNFAVCVVLQFVFQIAIGEKVPLKKLLLSFTAYDSVYSRNYNWYIMLILILYFLTFISFAIFKKNKYLGAALVTVPSLTLTVVFYIMPNFADKWSNMTLVYPLGIWYSILKEKIDAFLFKDGHPARYFTCLTVILLSYLTVGCFKGTNDFVHNLFGGLFALLIVLVLMKVKIGNPILEFFGKNTNGIYLLQTIPFHVLRAIGLSVSNKYVFVFVSLVLTSLAAASFNFCFGRLKTRIDRGGNLDK